VFINRGTGKWSWSGTALLAEAGTIQIEFITLSKRTGNPSYGEKVTKVRLSLSLSHTHTRAADPKSRWSLLVVCALGSRNALGGRCETQYIEQLDKMEKPDGALYPIHLSANAAAFGTRICLVASFFDLKPISSSRTTDVPHTHARARTADNEGRRITLGAMGDSFYEYLIKTWYVFGRPLLFSFMTPSSYWAGVRGLACADTSRDARRSHRLLVDKEQSMFYRMYVESAEAIREHLISKSKPNGLTYIAERSGSHNSPKMDHLACFAGSFSPVPSRSPQPLRVCARSTQLCPLPLPSPGGMYALGSRHLRPEHRTRAFKLSPRLHH
jgi:hypothetical protein